MKRAAAVVAVLIAAVAAGCGRAPAPAAPERAPITNDATQADVRANFAGDPAGSPASPLTGFSCHTYAAPPKRLDAGTAWLVEVCYQLPVS